MGHPGDRGAERRICFVVQRYGEEVTGGAERLCRDVARHLARRYALTVVTTCALDYLTWRNHYPPGEGAEGGVGIIRFPVERTRKVRSFGRLSQRLYGSPHRLSDEVRWMERQGPDAPGVWRFLEEERDRFDLFVFFTYLYATTFFGLPKVASKSLLVPMAHPEEPLGLEIFRHLFNQPRGFIFNTPEERDLVHGTFRCGHVPHSVIGTGVEMPAGASAGEARHGSVPKLVFTGRLDVNKGVGELLDFFRRYVDERPGRRVELALAGVKKMPLPRHPGIRFLGFLPEEEKERLVAEAAAVVVPSPHESLSISALEAWAHSRPVVANARSAVLAGQCRRSGGGLPYASYEEFAAALDRVLGEPAAAGELGSRGREFVGREYAWDVVERRYAAFIDPLLEEISRP